MGQEFSGNCHVASRNALLHNGATNATRSRRSDSEEAPPCRTRVLGAELDESLATLNFREFHFPAVRCILLLPAGAGTGGRKHAGEGRAHEQRPTMPGKQPPLYGGDLAKVPLRAAEQRD